MAFEEMGSSLISPRRFAAVREFIHQVTRYAFNQDWPFAKFSSIRLRVNPKASESGLDKSIAGYRDLTPIERRFCNEVWSEAGLQPIEKSRRSQRDEYLDALLNHRGIESKFGLNPEFVFQYILRNWGEKEKSALVVHSKDVLTGIMKTGEYDFLDTFGNPATHFNTSLLAPVAALNKAVPICVGWIGAVDQDWLDFDAARRALDDRRLSRAWIEQIPHKLRLHAERYQMVIESGLPLPDTPEGRYPDGIGSLADRAGVTRPTFTASVKLIYTHLYEKRKADRARLLQG